MKKRVWLVVALLMIAVVAGAKQKGYSYNRGINVIPVPKQLTIVSDGRFTVDSRTVIVVNSPNFASTAVYLASKIKISTGYDLSISDQMPQSNYIFLQLNTRVAAGMEGYTLNSSTSGVTIDARTPSGLFYGVQTLLQLLPAQIESPRKVSSVEWSLPLVQIVDEPRFKYRGVMLDPVRHFLSVDFIKKQLDIFAMFKINRFHWHLTDDQGWRIEIKKYPKLTQMGSVRTEGDGSTYGPYFYTQDQIKDVVAYAANLYIDVIPEIELPGHGLAALSGYPEFSCTGGPFTPRIIWGVEEDVYCVGKESTFSFWQDVLDEVAALFPSQYFHIGGDECPKVRWAKCADCQRRAAELGLKVEVENIDGKEVKHSVEDQLQSYAVKRVERYLASKDKKMIGWDEILEGGLAPGAIVMSWRGEQGGLAAASAEHEVIMTPGSGGMYIDQYQGALEVEPMTIGGRALLSKTYAYDPIPKGLDPSKHKYVLGAQCNMWAEYLLDESAVEYMLYPRVLALAELTWSEDTKRDFSDFVRRIDNACVRMDYHGVNYHIPMPEGVLTRNVVFTGKSKTLEFNNSRNYPMVYTLNGRNPSAKSTLYSLPIEVSGDKTLKIATLLPSGKVGPMRTVEIRRESFAPPVVADSLVRVDRGVNADGSLASIVWDGTFEVKDSGVYTFVSDMNELWVDGVKLIDNNAIASRHQHKKVQKALATGRHTYKVIFKNLVQNGWPQSWNYKNFGYKLDSEDRFTMVKLNP